jgi:hypothetical protein
MTGEHNSRSNDVNGEMPQHRGVLWSDVSKQTTDPITDIEKAAENVVGDLESSMT